MSYLDEIEKELKYRQNAIGFSVAKNMELAIRLNKLCTLKPYLAVQKDGWDSSLIGFATEIKYKEGCLTVNDKVFNEPYTDIVIRDYGFESFQITFIDTRDASLKDNSIYLLHEDTEKMPFDLAYFISWAGNCNFCLAEVLKGEYLLFMKNESFIDGAEIELAGRRLKYKSLTVRGGIIGIGGRYDPDKFVPIARAKSALYFRTPSELCLDVETMTSEGFEDLKQKLVFKLSPELVKTIFKSSWFSKQDTYSALTMDGGFFDEVLLGLYPSNELGKKHGGFSTALLAAVKKLPTFHGESEISVAEKIHAETVVVKEKPKGFWAWVNSITEYDPTPADNHSSRRGVSLSWYKKYLDGDAKGSRYACFLWYSVKSKRVAAMGYVSCSVHGERGMHDMVNGRYFDAEGSFKTLTSVTHNCAVRKGEPFKTEEGDEMIPYLMMFGDIR